MGIILTLLILTIFVIWIALASFNDYLPKWACTILGWHIAPKKPGFDGVNLFGICPRCGKKVLRDSQGNWF